MMTVVILEALVSAMHILFCQSCCFKYSSIPQFCLTLQQGYQFFVQVGGAR